jgi:23S rRNA (guanosine2251-2'-O)-methyltransferase
MKYEKRSGSKSQGRTSYGRPDAMRTGRRITSTTKTFARPAKTSSAAKKTVVGSAADSKSESIQNDSFCVFGINAVTEAIETNPQKIEKLYIQTGKKNFSAEKYKTVLSKNKIALQMVDERKITSLVGPVNHQGVVVLMRDFEYVEMDEFLKTLKIENNPCLVLLDEIEDTHNVGAIIRSAVAAGVSGIIIPKHRGAPINGTVYKTSAGLVGKVPIIKVTNINTAIEKLKAKHIWVVGLDGENSTKTNDGTRSDMWNTDLKMPMCVVVGNEGEGVREKTKEHCDYLVSIPMSPLAESLNASVSAALLMYEWKRQNS